MISQPVKKESDLDKELSDRGFKKTSETTATGTYWRHDDKGHHILVPFSFDGFYPDWMLWELLAKLSEIETNGIGDPLKPSKGKKAEAKKKKK